MTSKPKFKVGDKVINFFDISETEWVIEKLTIIKVIFNQKEGFKYEVKSFGRWLENELLTKEEAKQKMQEFLNDE